MRPPFSHSRSLSGSHLPCSIQHSDILLRQERLQNTNLRSIISICYDCKPWPDTCSLRWLSRQRDTDWRRRHMSDRRDIRVGILAILVAALSVVGCQSNPATTSVRYDNVRFMDVWSTYTHCLVLGSNPIGPARFTQITRSQSGPGSPRTTRKLPPDQAEEHGDPAGLETGGGRSCHGRCL
jgi:hypothetical protein